MIMKKHAIIIGSKACRETNLDRTTNIDSGFIVACMWPLSFTVMKVPLNLFKVGGILDSGKNITWMRLWETVRTEVMSPPLAIDI